MTPYYEIQLHHLRHALHLALQTQDFTIFKSLQTTLLPTILSQPTTSPQHQPPTQDLTNLSLSLLQIALHSYRTIHTTTLLPYNTAQDTERDTSTLTIDTAYQLSFLSRSVTRTFKSASLLISETESSGSQHHLLQAFTLSIALVSDVLQLIVQTLSPHTLKDLTGDFIALEYKWQEIQLAGESVTAVIERIFKDFGTPPCAFGDQMVGRKRNSSASNATSWVRRLSISLFANASKEDDKKRGLIDPITVVSEAAAVLPLAHLAIAKSLSPIPHTPRNVDMDVNPFDTTVLGKNRETDEFYDCEEVSSTPVSPTHISFGKVDRTCGLKNESIAAPVGLSTLIV